MRFALPVTPRRWITLGIIVPMVTVLFLISGIFQWSRLNCWHEELDINTGRVRHTRYLLFCQIGDRSENTWLSRAQNSSKTSPDWRRVNTFSPGVRYSPHYRFHGAIHQINMLELADHTIPFDPDARRKVAAKLLSLWQNDDSYSDAAEFVQKITESASALKHSGSSVFTAADVPAD